MSRIWEAARDLFSFGNSYGDNWEDEVEADEHSSINEEHGDLIPLYPERTSQANNCPIIRAEPRDMDDATLIAEEIKRRVPVILNLENCAPEDRRRIRDFLGGVTYGLNGYMKKLGSWVYACSPFDMPIDKLVLETSQPGNPRYERDNDTD